MSRIPRATGIDLVAALGKLGFPFFASKAATISFVTKMAEATVVPAHSCETIGPGLLYKILRDCQLSVDVLKSLL